MSRGFRALAMTVINFAYVLLSARSSFRTNLALPWLMKNQSHSSACLWNARIVPRAGLPTR